MNKRNCLRKEHYSIRKLTIGACSILIGTSLFWLDGQTAVVHAAPTIPTTTQEVQTSEPNDQDNAQPTQNNSQDTTESKKLTSQAKIENLIQTNQPTSQSPSQPLSQTNVTNEQTNQQKDTSSDKSEQTNDSHIEQKSPDNGKNNATQTNLNSETHSAQVKKNNPIDKKDLKTQSTSDNKTILKDSINRKSGNILQKSDDNSKSNNDYRIINLKDLTANQKQYLSDQLGISLQELDYESNINNIVIPASEWLGTASWNYQILNMQTDVLKVNTDTSLPFKIVSKIEGGNVAHNIDYELRIQLDHRLDPYVAAIKVSRQGDVNNTNMLPQKSMTKNADGSWSLPLFAVHGGVIGLANVDHPYTNPHCDIIFKDQVNNFYANLGDLKSNPLQYAIYGYDKKTGKVIGNYKSTGYIVSQDSLFNKPIATGDDAEKPSSYHQPYYQGADLTVQYDKTTNTINALYNPSMLGNWFWGVFNKAKIYSLNYQVDPRLVPYIDHITLINYKSGRNAYPFNDNGRPKEMSIVNSQSDLTFNSHYIGQGQVKVSHNNMDISGFPIWNHYVGIAFHLNQKLSNVVKDLDLEEKANSRLMFGVYFTAQNGKMAPNTLATNAFDIDRLRTAYAYQPVYTPVTVTKGNNIYRPISDTSIKSWANDKAPIGKVSYSVKTDPQFIFSPDQSTGNVLVTPKENTTVGMHYMVVIVTYSDNTNDQVNVPVYVKDLHHDITWGKNYSKENISKEVIRTIILHNPDGLLITNKQVVHFIKTQTIDNKTDQIINYGKWKLENGSKRDWAKFTAPIIKDYTADPISIAEKTVNADTKNETVNIYYHKNNNGGGNQPTKPTSPVKPTKPIQPTDPLPPSEPIVVPPTSTPKPTQPTPKSTPIPQPSQASQPTQPTTVKHIKHHNPPKPDTHTTPAPKPTPNPASKPTPKPSYNYNNRPHGEIINSNPINSSSNIMPHGETTPATISSNITPHSQANIIKPGTLGSNVAPNGEILPSGDKIGPKGTIINDEGEVIGYIDKNGKAHLTLPQTSESQNNSLKLGLIGLTSLALAGIITLLGRSDRKRNK